MAVGPVAAAAGFLLLATTRPPFDFWTQMLPGLLVNPVFYQGISRAFGRVW